VTELAIVKFLTISIYVPACGIKRDVCDMVDGYLLFDMPLPKKTTSRKTVVTARAQCPLSSDEDGPLFLCALMHPSRRNPYVYEDIDVISRGSSDEDIDEDTDEDDSGISSSFIDDSPIDDSSINESDIQSDDERHNNEPFGDEIEEKTIFKSNHLQADMSSEDDNSNYDDESRTVMGGFNMFKWN
jgi:hypothetical protein